MMSRSNSNRNQMRRQNQNDPLERWMNAWLPWQSMEATFGDSGWMPAVNISEDQDSYFIQAELPGVNREDIRVTYNNGVLTLQGERRQENEQNDRQYHRVERVYGMFERSFRLPTTIRADQIQAEFRDGLLTLTVPKAEEAKPRDITINVRDGGAQQGGNGGQRSSGQAGDGQQSRGASNMGTGSESYASEGAGQEDQGVTWGNQEGGSSGSSGARQGGSSSRSGSGSGSSRGSSSKSTKYPA